jgi:broad specificity phosphatase PhoE
LSAKEWIYIINLISTTFCIWGPNFWQIFYIPSRDWFSFFTSFFIHTGYRVRASSDGYKSTHRQQTHTIQRVSSSTLMACSTEHNDVTLALARKESRQHHEGMPELYNHMRKKSLTIKAYSQSHPKYNETNTQPKSSKIVHFVRHGQGFHNLMADMYVSAGKEWNQYERSDDNPYVLPEVLDAPLTQKGREQAKAIQSLVQNMDCQPELVVLSSNCRALQTGLIACGHLNVQFIAHEMVREETGVHICDKRRTIKEQKIDFPTVDFRLIEHDDDLLFREDRRENKMEIGERIYAFMEWLGKRDEGHICVTSHSGWLMTLFNGIVECEEDHLKEWFQTGELRTVKLEFDSHK